MTTRKFTLEVVDYDENLSIETKNDGFNGMEIIGILELKIRDISEQMMMPAKFKRTKIKEDGAYAVVKEGEEV